MSIREQRTAWAPNYFADADSPPAFGRIAAEAGRRAGWSAVLAIGVFAALALASSVQAILAPELLGGIFERL
jgi:hypothetical protein